jgi:hypothetical protein
MVGESRLAKSQSSGSDFHPTAEAVGFPIAIFISLLPWKINNIKTIYRVNQPEVLWFLWFYGL